MLEADISVGALADRDGWFGAGPVSGRNAWTSDIRLRVRSRSQQTKSAPTRCRVILGVGVEISVRYCAAADASCSTWEVVTRRRSRGYDSSKGRPRCIVQRLSQTTRSPARHLWR